MVYLRSHSNGVTSRVVATPAGRYLIEVVDNTGRPVTVTDLSRPTLEAALERADEIVRMHRPHVCALPACTEWPTFGAGSIGDASVLGPHILRRTP